MPNAKGGKGYKKGKHGEEEAVLLECNDSENQMYGRVMKSLGNRRFRIFCNDNKERICRVCGSMRKSQWVEEGALVLISIRELSMATVYKVEVGEGEKEKDKVTPGDIIGLIDMRMVGKMKKIVGINPLLFTNVEARDAEQLKKSIKAQEDGVEENDDFFTRGSDIEDDLEGDGEETDKKTKSKARELAISEARDMKYMDDENLNIDDI